MSWLYDIINRSREENSKTMEWMVRQIDNQDSRIEDNHRDLYEVMGNISYMKDDLKKLVNMNHGSFIQYYQKRDQSMEEASMEQPINEQKGKK